MLVKRYIVNFNDFTLDKFWNHHCWMDIAIFLIQVKIPRSKFLKPIVDIPNNCSDVSVNEKSSSAFFVFKITF